jgi:protein-S-isoprenylcysteine O-methyltransferase Ste14
VNMSLTLLIISFIWLSSEVVLARVKHSKEDSSSQQLDQSSLRLLWITIICSVFLGVFLAMENISFFKIRSSFISVLGIGLIFLGLAIRWIAILTLKKYFTVDVSVSKNQKIVKEGIYKFIRHPAYAGSLLSFLGLGVAFANWLSVLVIFFPILGAFIHRMGIEEKALKEVLGNEYVHYSQTTKRLIPKIY